MFWTLELASYLEEAPWPATKDELIDYSIRSGAPLEVVENLQELDDEGRAVDAVGVAFARLRRAGIGEVDLVQPSVSYRPPK